MRKIRALLNRYGDIVSYLFFGGLTTLVNFLVYFPLYNWLGFSVKNTIICRHDEENNNGLG